MPPRGSTAVKAKVTRLPPLPHLRVKTPNVANQNPCNTVMASVLNCWASSGYSVEGCANLETSLRKCMDVPVRYPHRNDCGRYCLAACAVEADCCGVVDKEKIEANETIAETNEPEEEYHQLPFVENVPTDGWTTQEEIDEQAECSKESGKSEHLRLEGDI